VVLTEAASLLLCSWASYSQQRHYSPFRVEQFALSTQHHTPEGFLTAL